MQPEAWKSSALNQQFLQGVRGAMPFAKEQLEMMLRVISHWQPQPKMFLDLGCGDGILGRAIEAKYPRAKGVFVDFSENMLAAAQKKSASSAAIFINADFSSPNWVRSLEKDTSFDVIVSGYAIHTQPDARKKEIYREIYNLLRAGGVFLHLEQVTSATDDVKAIFDDHFIESIHSFLQKMGKAKSREVVAHEYFNRPNVKAKQLASANTQCVWLEEIGFRDVDCYFKTFELTLFGGRKR